MSDTFCNRRRGHKTTIWPNPQMNQYRIKKTIGEGVYGIVFKAVEIATNEIVAIKQFKNNTDEALAKREVQMCSLLNHPNIVTFRDSFRHQGLVHLVFDYVPQTLLSYLGRHSVSPELAQELVVQLSRAIECCHVNQIIHRGRF